MCNKGIHGDMCVCERDRLRGVSGNGRHTNVCVCVCQTDRLRGSSGKL